MNHYSNHTNFNLGQLQSAMNNQQCTMNNTMQNAQSGQHYGLNYNMSNINNANMTFGLNSNKFDFLSSSSIGCTPFSMNTPNQTLSFYSPLIQQLPQKQIAPEALPSNQFLFNHCISENNKSIDDQNNLSKLKIQSNFHSKRHLVTNQELETMGQFMKVKLLTQIYSNNQSTNKSTSLESVDLFKQSQIPLISTVFSGFAQNQLHDISTCGSRTHEEQSFDFQGEIPQESLSDLLNAEVEKGFSVSVQKKRRRLVEVLSTKRPFEIIIRPHKKAFKGDNVSNFRGSKFRGISKNGNSWQILVMVNRKKKYLGTLPTEEQAARFYDKVAIQYQGHKAITNYPYSKTQIIQILKSGPLL